MMGCVALLSFLFAAGLLNIKSDNDSRSSSPATRKEKHWITANCRFDNKPKDQLEYICFLVSWSVLTWGGRCTVNHFYLQHFNTIFWASAEACRLAIWRYCIYICSKLCKLTAEVRLQRMYALGIHTQVPFVKNIAKTIRL